MKTELALQTFTIRKFLKKEADRNKAFRQMKKAGVSGIELARVSFTPPVIAHINKLRKRENIDVLSTQIKLDTILKDLDWTIEFHKMLECPRAVVSVISHKHLKKGRSGLKEYGALLNDTGKTLKEEGIQLLFHHHNYEFVPLAGEEDVDGMTVLLEVLDPEYVNLVLDTYWLQRSGHDPAAFIRSMSGRVKGVHLRDMTLKGPLWNPGIRDCALGEGNLDFKGILEACEEAGVEYAAIEQDSSDPWKSVERSLAHLDSFLPKKRGI
ncbi:MAG: sugar phosphate isomerase/epimerase [Spirochaetales bacterium]|nr:sugar phosphate isomerase/epimerase [Spirochaetales bacterium]